jgi:hypothetical protein
VSLEITKVSYYRMNPVRSRVQGKPLGLSLKFGEPLTRYRRSFPRVSHSLILCHLFVLLHFFQSTVFAPYRMRFSNRFPLWACIALGGFSSLVIAQTDGFNVVVQPTEYQEVKAGTVLRIIWVPTREYPGNITIYLMQGETDITMDRGPILASKYSLEGNGLLALSGSRRRN